MATLKLPNCFKASDQTDCQTACVSDPALRNCMVLHERPQKGSKIACDIRKKETRIGTIKVRTSTKYKNECRGAIEPVINNKDCVKDLTIGDSYRAGAREKCRIQQEGTPVYLPKCSDFNGRRLIGAPMTSDGVPFGRDYWIEYAGNDVYYYKRFCDRVPGSAAHTAHVAFEDQMLFYDDHAIDDSNGYFNGNYKNYSGNLEIAMIGWLLLIFFLVCWVCCVCAGLIGFCGGFYFKQSPNKKRTRSDLMEDSSVV